MQVLKVCNQILVGIVILSVNIHCKFSNEQELKGWKDRFYDSRIELPCIKQNMVFYTDISSFYLGENEFEIVNSVKSDSTNYFINKPFIIKIKLNLDKILMINSPFISFCYNGKTIHGFGQSMYSSFKPKYGDFFFQWDSNQVVRIISRNEIICFPTNSN